VAAKPESDVAPRLLVSSGAKRPISWRRGLRVLDSPISRAAVKFSDFPRRNALRSQREPGQPLSPKGDSLQVKERESCPNPAIGQLTPPGEEGQQTLEWPG
jgi:hypothetical protein